MSSRILLVEGKNDEHVVRHLCKARQIAFSFEIRQAGEDEEGGGKDRLLELVPVLLKASGLERLAIVIDADTDLGARWASLRHRLTVAGCSNAPVSPSDGGTIFEFDDGFLRPRIALWVMPDNRLPGMLEDFLAFLVPSNDKMMPHVDRFLDNIPLQDRMFGETHKPKARLHSFLAIQREPGKPLGLAIACRFLDPGRPEATLFLTWLSQALID